MYLLVGLGNPGKAYQNTRHNFGFRVLDFIAREEGIRFSQKSPLYLEASTVWGGIPVFLLKPLTYMNRSGLAVRQALEVFALDDISRLFVILDDLQLPFGVIRIRRQGSDGGQKGLRSIIQILGRQDFPRMRLGIGNDVEDATQYVLSPFSTEEEKVLPYILEHAASALRTVVLEGIDIAMSRFNGQVLDRLN